MQDDIVRTSRKSIKRPVLIALCAIFLLALGIGLVVHQRYVASTRDRIADFLATLPEPINASAGNIDVSFFNRSVTLRDVTGSLDGEDKAHTFSVKTATISGLNLDALDKNAGVMQLAEKMEIRDVAVAGPLVTGSIDSYVLEGISGDFPLLLSEGAAVLPSLLDLAKNPEELSRRNGSALLGGVARLLRAYETVRIKKAVITGYAYSAAIDGETLGVKVEHAEVNDYSIRSLGRTIMHNLAATMNDVPVVSIAALGMDRGAFPSFVPFLEETAFGLPPALLLRKLFRNELFEMKNLRCEGLAVRTPNAQDKPALTLSNATFSAFSAPAGDVEMDFSFTGLLLDKTIIADNKAVTPKALALFPDPFTLEGAFKMATASGKPNAFDLSVDRVNLKGPGLGEFNLDFKITDISALNPLMDLAEKTALTALNLAMTDSGLMEIMFTVKGERMGTSAGEEREAALSRLAAEALTSSGPSQRALAEAVATFLKKPGGELRISLRPATPLTGSDLQQLPEKDPESIGLTILATPGK